jgi:hypothetical protein
MMLAIPLAIIGIAFVGASALWAKAQIVRHPLPGETR